MRTFALVFLVGAASVGCASSHEHVAQTTTTAAGTCKRSNTPSCDGFTPVDIAPILANRCQSCHSPGGPADEHDFTKEATVQSHRSRIGDNVAACAMPPRTAPPLTDDEAFTLVRWARCGK